jgi:sulfur-carrier protein
MAIRVEFYGLARQRAGVSDVRLNVAATEATLREVLSLVSDAAPGLSGSGLLVDGRLHPTLSVNLGGQRFVSDPATPIQDGQCLLILSADAGG